MGEEDTVKRLLAYSRPQWRMFAATLLLFILGAAVEPLIPALFKMLIDSGFKDGLQFPLWLVPVVVIGLFMLRGGLSFLGSCTIAMATASVVLAVRQDLMRALLKAEASLFTRLSPGQAVSKIVSDPQTSSQVLGGVLISIVRDSTTLLFLVGYLFYLNWTLTLIAFVSMPLLGVSIRMAKTRLDRLGRERYASQERLAQGVDDNTRAWRVVRTFGATELEFKRFMAEAQQYKRMTIKQAVTSALMTPVTQVVAAIGVATIITLAMWQASQGQTSVGEFVSFLTALLMTISPMRHLSDVYQPINNALVHARGCFELMHVEAEPDLGQRDMPQCSGRIVFENVSVTFPGANSPALNAFSLEVQAGQSVALVGASGAGKTTVMNTLLRFNGMQSGHAYLDGVPIEALRLTELRKHFAVVSQDIALFDGTVADNVAYAHPNGVNFARVEHCLQAANLWEHVSSLPDGVHTAIGANGSLFSGGQRQRLAIARALYRDAVVWFFDEATSALDSESERLVQAAIEKQRHAKTMIMIAHRLSTIRNADLICVMADGAIVEQGTHEHLMVLGGYYAELVRMQSAA